MGRVLVAIPVFCFITFISVVDWSFVSWLTFHATDFEIPGTWAKELSVSGSFYLSTVLDLSALMHLKYSHVKANVIV